MLGKRGRLMNHDSKGNLTYKFMKLDKQCHVWEAWASDEP